MRGRSGADGVDCGGLAGVDGATWPGGRGATALLDRQPEPGRHSPPPSAEDLSSPGSRVPAGSAPTSAAATGEREVFLDTLRAVALVRVVVWHALAAALISWTVAAMPAMFFVAGSLIARSLRRQPVRRLLRNRLRRLLIPFWVFGAVVLSTLTAVYLVSPSARTQVPASSLLAWVIPLADPHGSSWEGGWASAPLWYLRCYLWLLLLSPILVRLHRRFGLRTLVLPIAGIFIVDALMRHPAAGPTALFDLRFYLGDLTTFGTFWLLGFSHRDGAFGRATRSTRLQFAVLGGAAAALWVGLGRVSSAVVNDSYPLLLFVGIAWLGLFLALEPWLERLGSHRLVAPVVFWLGCRAVTLYLWHPIAIVGAYSIRSVLMPTAPAVSVLPLVGVLSLLLCVVFGRFEDFAARRPGRWWPGRTDPVLHARVARWFSARLSRRRRAVWGAAAGTVVGVILLGSVLPAAVGTSATAESGAGSPSRRHLALPPAPSGKPDQIVFASPSSTSRDAMPTGEVALDQPGAVARVAAAADHWRAAKGVAGIQLGVADDSGRIALVSGTRADSTPLGPTARYPITSITKTMTATLILQLVAEGKIGLDDPLPRLSSVPTLDLGERVTLRHLLRHTSGLLPYDRSPGYAAVSQRELSAAEAVALVADQPLEFAPGSQFAYSNTGFLALGLLAEQLTGLDYETLLEQRIFGPAEMRDTWLDTTPTAGWAGFSSGGVVSTIEDQLRFGQALFQQGRLLDDETLATMLDLDNDVSVGLGVFPACPCSLDRSTKVYSTIGLNGGQAGLQWAPTLDVVIALNLTESMWTGELNRHDVEELVTAVQRALLR